MKNVLLLIIFHSLIYYGCSVSDQDKNNDNNPEKSNALKDGPKIMINKNDDTIYITNYRNGKRNGVSKHFYANGKLQLLLRYKDDKLNGISSTYFNNGRLRSKILYKNDLIWKIYEVRDSLGIPLDHGNVSNGNGFMKHYLFDTNYEEGKIINGLKHGYWKTISNSGHVDSVFYCYGESEFLPGYLDNLY